MKQLLCALCASLILAPLSFACAGDNGNCASQKKADFTVADCGKCKKGGDCDKDKQPDGKLA